MSKPRLISVDGGNGYFKAKSSTNEISFPSIISRISQSIDFDMAFSPNHDFVIEFDGDVWAIGDTVTYKGMLATQITDRSRIETEFYRVLFAAAMAATLGNSCSVAPVMSLPPAAYWDKDTVKQQLAGVYEVGVPHEGKFRKLRFDVPIEGIRVIPEGVGTICTFVLNPNGGEQDDSLFHQAVGIVDIGTYTTDLLLLQNLKLIRTGTTSLPGVGLDFVKQRLTQAAAKNGVDLKPHQLENALKSGYYLKGGHRLNITKDVNLWGKELSQTIDAGIRSRWGGGNDAETIIVTGGGAQLVIKQLAAIYGDRVVIADSDGIAPHFANCEGAYRFGLLLDRAGRS